MTKPTMKANLKAEMQRFIKERGWSLEQVIDSLFETSEDAARLLRERDEARSNCELLKAEIEALEAEIELCPSPEYHKNPAGLVEPTTQDYVHAHEDTFVELITVEGQYSGYFREDLEATMDEEELKRWRDWSRGITGAIHEGRLLIYTHDWNDFKVGRPNLD